MPDGGCGTIAPPPDWVWALEFAIACTSLTFKCCRTAGEMSPSTMFGTTASKPGASSAPSVSVRKVWANICSRGPIPKDKVEISTFDRNSNSVTFNAYIAAAAVPRAPSKPPPP